MAITIDLSKYADTDVIIDVASLSLGVGKYVEYVFSKNFQVFISRTGYGTKFTAKTDSNRTDDEFYVRDSGTLTRGFIENYRETRNAHAYFCFLRDNEKQGAYWEKPSGKGEYEFQTLNHAASAEINFNVASSYFDISSFPLGATLYAKCKLSGRKRLIDIDKNSEYAILDFYNARANRNRPIYDKNDPEADLHTVIVKPDAVLEYNFFKALPKIERIQSFLLEHRDWAEQIPDFSERLHC